MAKSPPSSTSKIPSFGKKILTKYPKPASNSTISSATSKSHPSARVVSQWYTSTLFQVMKVRDRKDGRIVAAKIINKKDKNKAPTKNLVLEERRILKAIKSQYVYAFEEMY